MASYANIRRNIMREFGLTDIEKPYLPSETDVAAAISNFGESIKHVISCAYYEPEKTWRPTEPFRTMFRENMSALFPTYSTGFWRDEYASAQNLSQQVSEGTTEGKAVYGTFVRGLVASWQNPYLSKPPFNYLSYSQMNPSHNVAYNEAASAATATVRPSPQREPLFEFGQAAAFVPSPAG